LAVTLTVLVAALVMGPCGALGRTIRPVVEALQARAGLASVLGGYAIGIILNVVVLGALWGMWQLRKPAVFVYGVATVVQVAVGGLTTGMTPLVLTLIVVVRAPPLVAAYYYSDRFR
jgi:hypothetical protein